jgi:hypothetical protein
MPDDDDAATPTHRPSEGYEPSEPRRVGHTVHRPDDADVGDGRGGPVPRGRAVGEHRRHGSEGEGG